MNQNLLKYDKNPIDVRRTFRVITICFYNRKEGFNKKNILFVKPRPRRSRQESMPAQANLDASKPIGIDYAVWSSVASMDVWIQPSIAGTAETLGRRDTIIYCSHSLMLGAHSAQQEVSIVRLERAL